MVQVEEAERKAKEEAERNAALERAEAAKKPRHQDLDLTATGDELPPTELSSLRFTLSSLCDTKRPRVVGTGTTSRDNEIKADDKLNELEDQLRKVTLRSLAKVTDDRVYSIAYHPEEVRTLKRGRIASLIAVTAKRHNLFW